MTHPENDRQKVTYSNSSLKLCQERKYDISIILLKKCKGLYFLWQRQ